MFYESPESFMMHSSVGIHAVDKDGIILYANQYELELLGYSEEEYVGHHVSEFQLDTETIDIVIHGLKAFKDFKNYPARVQGKDGVKYILYTSNVCHENGEFIHTRCFASEIDYSIYQVFKRRFDEQHKA
jgi:PAS domain S-box-containing protein